MMGAVLILEWDECENLAALSLLWSAVLIFKKNLRLIFIHLFIRFMVTYKQTIETFTS